MRGDVQRRERRAKDKALERISRSFKTREKNELAVAYTRTKGHCTHKSIVVSSVAVMRAVVVMLRGDEGGGYVWW